MATPIQRIEKDFLLKMSYDERLPIIYLHNRKEYVFTVERPIQKKIYLKSEHPVAGLKPFKKMNLMFNYQGRLISFFVKITAIEDTMVITDVPESLFRNLVRSYSRVAAPTDIQVQINFLGDRYSLNYPRLTEYEPVDPGNFMRQMDPKNFSGLVLQLAQWIKTISAGYKLVIFKDVKPAALEEQLLAGTGKTLYLPSTLAKLPQTDPYPQKRLITEEIFLRHLERTGIGTKQQQETLNRFIKTKFDAGIFSDMWVPLVFQEYVIGYIHIWINKEGVPPFTFSTIEILYQFASVFSFSLKLNGYFEAGKVKNTALDGMVIDISASGLLFAYPLSAFSSALRSGNELMIKIITPNRFVHCNAKIVRQYKDNDMGYFGCRFLDMAPEDVRFLFESIYGKPLTDSDAAFLAGQV
ncbi:MAG: PilZ domain-containing protein [Spirochaetaceae bacterium]|jgi:hypothetical protein|nr:PilZ domain-containing protein [Spirochaetaceae bacterium]